MPELPVGSVSTSGPPTMVHPPVMSQSGSVSTSEAPTSMESSGLVSLPPKLFAKQAESQFPVVPPTPELRTRTLPAFERRDPPQLVPQMRQQQVRVEKPPAERTVPPIMQAQERSSFQVHPEDKLLPEKEKVEQAPPDDPTTPAAQLIRASAMLPSFPTPSFVVQPPVDVFLEQPTVDPPPPKRTPPIPQDILQKPKPKHEHQWFMEGNEAPRYDYKLKSKPEHAASPRFFFQQLMRETRKKNEAEQRRLQAEKATQLKIRDELQFEKNRAQAKALEEAENQAERERLLVEQRKELEIQNRRAEEEKEHQRAALDLEADEFLQEMLQMKGNKQRLRAQEAKEQMERQQRLHAQALQMQRDVERRATEESKLAQKTELERIHRESEELKRQKELLRRAKEKDMDQQKKRERERIAREHAVAEKIKHERLQEIERKEREHSEKIRLAQEQKTKKTAEQWFSMARERTSFLEKPKTVPEIPKAEVKPPRISRTETRAKIDRFLGETILAQMKKKYPDFPETHSVVAKGINKGDITDATRLYIDKIAKRVVFKEITLEEAKKQTWEEFGSHLNSRFIERIETTIHNMGWKAPEKQVPETQWKPKEKKLDLPPEPIEDPKFDLAEARTKSKIEWKRMLKSLEREYNSSGRVKLVEVQNELETELEEPQLQGKVKGVQERVTPLLEDIKQNKRIRAGQALQLHRILKEFLNVLPTSKGKYRSRSLTSEEFTLFEQGIHAILNAHRRELLRKHLLWVQGTLNPESIQEITQRISGLRQDANHIQKQLAEDRKEISKYKQMLELLNQHGETERSKKAKGFSEKKHKSRVTAWLTKAKKKPRKKRAKNTKKTAGALRPKPVRPKPLPRPPKTVPKPVPKQEPRYVPELVIRAPNDYVRRKKRKYL